MKIKRAVPIRVEELTNVTGQPDAGNILQGDGTVWNSVVNPISFTTTVADQTTIEYTNTAKPDILPSLSLDFAKTKTLDSRVTFSRAAAGTYYDGKSTAKAEENLFLNSTLLGTPINITLTTGETAPDASATATKVTVNSNADNQVALASPNTGNFANIASTFSIFIKPGTAQWITVLIRVGSGNSGVRLWFDTVAGTIGTVNDTSGWTAVSSSVQSIGAWYRVVLTGFRNIDWTGVFALRIVDGDGAFDYTSVNGLDVTVWGAQVEQRSTVTAYTPTTTAEITNYIPVLKSAASGEPRFDHDPISGESLGLMLEEQRTNLLQRSEEFDNAAWTKSNVTVSPNQIIAPDGTLNGDKVFAGNGTFTSSGLSQALSADQSVNVTHTFSVYLKAGEFRYARVLIRGGGNFRRYGVLVDLQDGTILGEGIDSGNQTVKIVQIDTVGNGWCYVSLSAAFSDFGIRAVSVVPTNDTTLNWSMGLQFSQTFSGDGYAGIYIWGAQLEAGSFPTSYIKTTTAAVTRAADAASMTGANFSSWFRQDEGTIFTRIKPKALGVASGVTINNNTTANRIRVTTNTTAEQSNITRGGTAQATLDGGTPVENTDMSLALAYKTNDFALSLDGGTVATNTSGLLPLQLNQLQIGSETTTRGTLTLKKLSYYPKRLANLILQGLTK